MKTKMQMRFEYLVNEIIKAEPFITARDVVLEDFKLESERNYDLFCDNIYELMMSTKGIFSLMSVDFHILMVIRITASMYILSSLQARMLLKKKKM